MRVKVFAPAWCHSDQLDEFGWMELPDDAFLADVFRIIRIPSPVAKLMLVSVNGIAGTRATKLKDGDTVSFFAIPQGG